MVATIGLDGPQFALLFNAANNVVISANAGRLPYGVAFKLIRMALWDVSAGVFPVIRRRRMATSWKYTDPNANVNTATVVRGGGTA